MCERRDKVSFDRCCCCWERDVSESNVRPAHAVDVVVAVVVDADDVTIYEIACVCVTF